MTSLGVIGIDGGDLSKAIRELAEAVRFQGENIATLVEAADDEAEQIRQRGGIPFASATPSTYHGFKPGDNVVMLTPGGCVYGTVDPTAYTTANPEKNLPVRRDSGGGDAWPARYVVMADGHTEKLRDKIDPKPVFGLGTPPIGVDRDEWNRAAAEIAEERSLPVTFDYVKPDSWGRATPRRVLVQKFEAVSDNPRMQSIGGIDLDIPDAGSSRYRTFRLDRIAGTIRVEDSE